MKKKGFTLIELLVVIAIIAMLLAILMPALNKVKKIAQRVVCGTNLKGLGTAQSVYANDYEDQFTRQGGSIIVLNWAYTTPRFDDPAKKWSGAGGNLSVASSLYLLVREADVSPKSFVCGASGADVYDGKNGNNLDLVELWDFGGFSANGGAQFGRFPRGHCSYSLHQPYGRNAASGASSASFAIMGDKNPWYDPKLQEASATDAACNADSYTGYIRRMGGYYVSGATIQRWEIQVANTYAHGREGQNVAFGDGHSEYAKTSDVGIKHDNIYTKRGGAATDPEAPVRMGFAPGGNAYKGPSASFSINGVNSLDSASPYQPTDAADSLLVHDDDQIQ